MVIKEVKDSTTSLSSTTIRCHYQAKETISCLKTKGVWATHSRVLGVRPSSMGVSNRISAKDSSSKWATRPSTSAPVKVVWEEKHSLQMMI